MFSRSGLRLSGPAAVREYLSLLEIQPHEVLLLAADECRRKGLNLEGMHDLLSAWQKKGFVTGEAVREYLDKRRGLEALLREVFEACGHKGNPTVADMTLYQKWHGFGYDQELILCAAEQARNAEGGKMAYLDKVLEAWHEAGITDVSQARGRARPGEKS